eukprot:Opistho-2@69757
MGDAVVGRMAEIDRLVADSPERVILMLAGLLEQLILRNDLLPVRLNHFHARSPPPISVRSYLQRFAKYAPFGNECFILVLIYLDRIVQRSGVVVTSLNVHRLLVTGLMLAAKYSQDKYYTNKHYAKVGGLPVQELNMLEIEFLRMIDFDLHANVSWLEKYYAQLCAHCGHLVVDDLLAPPAAAPAQGQPSPAPVAAVVPAAQQAIAPALHPHTPNAVAAVAGVTGIARLDRGDTHLHRPPVSSPKRQAQEMGVPTSTPPRKRRQSQNASDGSPAVAAAMHSATVPALNSAPLAAGSAAAQSEHAIHAAGGANGWQDHHLHAQQRLRGVAGIGASPTVVATATAGYACDTGYSPEGVDRYY